jgi:hypothetical protein
MTSLSWNLFEGFTPSETRILGLPGWVFLERFIKRVADQQHLPGEVGDRAEIHLQEAELPGHQQGKEVIGQGEGAEVAVKITAYLS